MRTSLFEFEALFEPPKTPSEKLADGEGKSLDDGIAGRAEIREELSPHLRNRQHGTTRGDDQ